MSGGLLMNTSLLIVLVLFCIVVGYGLGIHESNIVTVVVFTVIAMVSLQAGYILTVVISRAFFR